MLRVFVTAASVGEREGSKQGLKRVKQKDKAVSRLHTVWADSGFDGAPFMQWVMDVCRWIVQIVIRPQQTRMLRAAQKAMGGRADVWMQSCWGKADDVTRNSGSGIAVADRRSPKETLINDEH